MYYCRQILKLTVKISPPPPDNLCCLCLPSHVFHPNLSSLLPVAFSSLLNVMEPAYRDHGYADQYYESIPGCFRHLQHVMLSPQQHRQGLQQDRASVQFVLFYCISKPHLLNQQINVVLQIKRKFTISFCNVIIIHSQWSVWGWQMCTLTTVTNYIYSGFVRQLHGFKSWTEGGKQINEGLKLAETIGVNSESV